MTTKLAYAILGTLEVRDGQRMVPLSAAKHRVLLACLLLRAGKHASLTELYEALWGDDLPAAPKTAVHNYVGRLRKTLNDAVIETTPNGYRIVVEPRQVDLLRFRRLVSQARQSGRNGDLVEAFHVLGAALDLWRGPVLADVPSDRVHQKTSVCFLVPVAGQVVLLGLAGRLLGVRVEPPLSTRQKDPTAGQREPQLGQGHPERHLQSDPAQAIQPGRHDKHERQLEPWTVAGDQHEDEAGRQGRGGGTEHERHDAIRCLRAEFGPAVENEPP